MKYEKRKTTKTVTTYRVDTELLEKFRKVCAKHNIKQIGIVEDAMIKVIEDLEGAKDE